MGNEVAVAVCSLCGVTLGSYAARSPLYCDNCRKAVNRVRSMLRRKHGKNLELRIEEFNVWKAKYQKKHGVLPADTVKEINSDYDKQLENSVLSRRKFYSSDEAMQALTATGDMQVCERLHVKASALPCGLCYGCQGCPKVPEKLRGPVRKKFGVGELLPQAFSQSVTNPGRFGKGFYSE